ncbi:hypothetical protein EG832_03960 [bacterium]|nr:hypothetical protein [bacterium]
MDRFIVNIIHRPELLPEYIDRVTQDGQTEELSKKEVVGESLDIFRLQQEIAHRNGLRTTIQMTYASLFNEEAIALAKDHHARYGDEISLTFLGLNCKEFRERYNNKELAIWLFSIEDKRKIVDDLFERFYNVFEFYPTSTGSYYMDAELVRYIKERYPMIKIAVATCFEEGPRVYHNCNNSWYTLLDGGPWTAWIPSKENIHCLAKDEADDIGIVAIPHLSRDLLASIDSPGLFFGTHPQNILRGMVYEGDQIPYMYNLIDQYRALMKQNCGFGYNMVYVGPGWMGKGGRWEANYHLLVKSYEDFLAYYGELKQQGQLIDQTMSEFADTFRAHQTYTEPLCALWRDILYGTDYQVFWYADPYFRVLVDMKQGGAITDLRPYAAQLNRPVGVGTPHLQNACYPYLVHSHYRAGAFTHYAGEGAIKSCKVLFEKEEIDLSACRTHAHHSIDGDSRVLIFEPVTLEFNGLTIELQTTYRFPKDSGEIWISRRIVKASNPNVKVSVDEYITSCYGTNEYPEDLSGVRLTVDDFNGNNHMIEYAYKCREHYLENAARVTGNIPQVNSLLSMLPGSSAVTGYIREGYAFAPNLTLGMKKIIGLNEELLTCLKVEKAK